ncbi:MAG: hypothetical protein J6Z47_03575 [Bacteroidales bacterium]|nr:hypothetical protein [Bacteroidales bacterium]
MKNFISSRRSLAQAALALAITVPSLVGCDFDKDGTTPRRRDVDQVPEAQLVSVTPESVAEMLSKLPVSLAQVREVRNAVGRSSANGYDEEYPFSNLILSPGSGVGDDRLRTRAEEYSQPLRDLISLYSDLPETRSSGFLEALSASGLQIYWPYSEDWDGVTLPVITYCSDGQGEKATAFKRERLPEGTWTVTEITVDEGYARTHPVWVVNVNEDSGYLTPQLAEKMGLVPGEDATRASADFKTLRLKTFKAHRNYDNWLQGGSEFFVKCGSLKAFTADVVSDLRLYSPQITDMMINVKRKQVGENLTFNTILASEWSPQLEECAFLMIEDDGGKRTTWKAEGSVKIKSKAYGFDVEFPLNKNDDIVWRGKLSQNYFTRYSGEAGRFGDVSLTFVFN